MNIDSNKKISVQYYGVYGNQVGVLSKSIPLKKK